jgi:hypothetical protein
LPTCRRQYPGRSDENLFARTIPSTSAFPETGAGRLLHQLFLRPAQRSLTLRPACSPSRLTTLCTRGFSSLVASTAALIATGWSEPVPGRVSPAVDHRLLTAHPVTAFGRSRHPACRSRVDSLTTSLKFRCCCFGSICCSTLGPERIGQPGEIQRMILRAGRADSRVAS